MHVLNTVTTTFIGGVEERSGVQSTLAACGGLAREPHRIQVLRL